MKQIFMKIIAAATVLMLFVSVSFSAVSVTEFSDVPTEFWGYETIMKMTEAGMFRGTTEPVNGVGIFSPDKVMTRAEFITTAIRAVYPDEAKTIENDQTRWWNSYYIFALQKGIVMGEELGSGELDEPMTREEMAMIMVRCVEKMGESLTQRIETAQIPDYAEIGDYYKDYVLDCFSFGLLCGIDTKSTFAPTKSLTRAQAATVLCRLVDKAERIEVEFPDTPDEGTTTPEVPDDTSTGNNGNTGNTGNSGNSGNSGNNSTGNSQGQNPGGNPPPDGNDSSQTPETNPPQNPGTDTPQPPAENEPEKLPWEDGGKQPSEYTWEEYNALPEEMKNAFYESFESEAAFGEWFTKVQPKPESDLPWDNGGKQPAEYTWAEYEALPEEMKNAFYESFESEAAFNEWFTKVQPEPESDLPWDNGGKQPGEYTWDEYEALPEDMKSAFYESFESEADFNEWFNRVQPEPESDFPWDNGGKQPSEYTWGEYEALTEEEQDAFFASFGSMEEFEAWLSANLPVPPEA